MKCAIIGGSNLPDDIPSSVIEMVDEFAQYCHSKKIEVLTGACPGYPYLIGKACLKHGVNVVGYSPAQSMEDHVNDYQNPTDGCSSYIFLDEDEKNDNCGFLVRSIPLINNADIIIGIEGNWGTLFELTAGVICGKKIILWQGFGGVCDNFNETYQKISKESQREYGEEVYYAKTLEEVKSLIER